jgi:hypothetical protein
MRPEGSVDGSPIDLGPDTINSDPYPMFRLKCRKTGIPFDNNNGNCKLTPRDWADAQTI